MTITESAQNTSRALSKLFTECWSNEAFKTELIAHPRATMEKFYGGPLKKSTPVVVDDQSNPDVIYLNLYAKPDYDNADFELDEEELEAVAGGWFVTLLWSGICFGNGEPASTSLSVKASE